MLLTEQAIAQKDFLRATELLDKHKPATSSEKDLRGWEWHHYRGQIQGEERFILGRHGTNEVTAVGLLPDGKTAWSAGRDKRVRFWDLPTRRQTGEILHDQEVYFADVSPDGRWLATIVSNPGHHPGDSPIFLWDIATGRLIDTLATNYWFRSMLQFSPDGKTLAYEDQIHGLHLLEIATKKETAFRPAWWNMLYNFGFAFAPRTNLIAYGAHGRNRDGAITIYDPERHEEIAKFIGHTDAVGALAFSPDGLLLASGGPDGTLRLWSFPEGRNILTRTNAGRDFYLLVFSPDGKTLAMANDAQRVELIDAGTGRTVHALRGHRGGIPGVAFTRDGASVITGGEDGTVRVWDAAPAPERPAGHPLPSGMLVTLTHAHSFKLSPRGDHLLTVLTNATVSIWETRTMRETVRSVLPLTNLSTAFQEAIAPGGTQVAFAQKGDSAEQAFLGDVRAGQIEWRTLRKVAGEPGRLQFSPDGQLLAFGSWPDVFLYDTVSGEEIRHLTVPPGDYSIVHGIVFSEDQTHLAALTHFGFAIVWKLHEDIPPRIFHPSHSQLKAAVFLDDQRNILVCGNDGVYLFDLISGAHLPGFTPRPTSCFDVALSPDATTIALAEGSSISLWSTASRQMVGHLRGHQQDIRCLAFGRSGQSIISASYDQLRIWGANAPVETLSNQP